MIELRVIRRKGTANNKKILGFALEKGDQSKLWQNGELNNGIYRITERRLNGK